MHCIQFDGAPEEITPRGEDGHVQKCLLCFRERTRVHRAVSSSVNKRGTGNGQEKESHQTELEKRERRLDEINEELLDSTGNGLEVKLWEIEEFAMKRIRNIQGLLGGDARRAKSELAKHCTDSRLPRKGTPHGQRRLEFIGRTFGWCRGTGMHGIAKS
jgi:hypothetical protein